MHSVTVIVLKKASSFTRWYWTSWWRNNPLKK